MESIMDNCVRFTWVRVLLKMQSPGPADLSQSLWIWTAEIIKEAPMVLMLMERSLAGRKLEATQCLLENLPAVQSAQPQELYFEMTLSEKIFR